MGTVSHYMKKNPQHHKAKFNEVILALKNYLALPMIKIAYHMHGVYLAYQWSVAISSDNQHKLCVERKNPTQQIPNARPIDATNLLQEKSDFTHSNTMKMKLCRVDKNVLNKEFLDAWLKNIN